MENGVYITVRQNWDGKLWPRLWPNERFAWKALEEETRMSKRQIRETCDWSLVPVRLVPSVKYPTKTGRALHLGESDE